MGNGVYLRKASREMSINGDLMRRKQLKSKDYFSTHDNVAI